MSTGTTAALLPAQALSPLAAAVKALYGIAGPVNDYIDNLINSMTRSENKTVSRTGLVLEGAKFGFGLGYVTSMIVIAAGQILLGNPLSAVGTVLTAATLTNPIAMTCAAFGAIYYGWAALSPQEQTEILDKLTKGLEVGIELIKSVIHFVVTKTKEIFTEKNIAEFKTFIKEYAAKFGKTLFDVTGAVTDFVTGTAERAAELTVKVAESVGETATDAASTSAQTLKVAYAKTGEAADATADAFKGAYKTAGEAAKSVKSAIARRTGAPNPDSGQQS